LFHLATKHVGRVHSVRGAFGSPQFYAISVRSNWVQRAEYSTVGPSSQGLDSVVKLDLLEKEPPKTIKKIWIEYHRDKDCIVAILEPKQFNDLRSRFEDCPMFVLPVPRKSGYETMLLQYKDNCWIVTTLFEFREKGNLADPVVDVRFFDELAESKELVLMRGMIHTDQLTSHLVQALVNQLQIFYTNDEYYNDYVKLFNHQPNEFDFEKLMSLVQSMGVVPVGENEAAESKKE